MLLSGVLVPTDIYASFQVSHRDHSRHCRGCMGGPVDALHMLRLLLPIARLSVAGQRCRCWHDMVFQIQRFWSETTIYCLLA